MTPLLILLAGVFVVVGGILVLRLHAFLVLILGALCVSALTSSEARYEQEISPHTIEIVEFNSKTGEALGKAGPKQTIPEGRSFVMKPKPDGGYGEPRLVIATPLGKDKRDPELSVVKLVGVADIEPGDLLVHQTHLAAAKKVSTMSIGALVAEGFGNTCTSIGILIAMAAIVGKCLFESGGAERIVVSIRRALGEKRASVAFLGSGFVLGIPVFADTVLYLLLPLGKAMRAKTGKHYVLYVLSIVAGVSMAHSLVPPTPGPLFVASELGVDVGLMMLGGLVTGLGCISAGYVYAKWADRRWVVPLRTSADFSEAQLNAMVNRDESTLPPLFVSLLPILLPVVLIAGGTIVDMQGVQVPGVDVWSDKNVALVAAAAVALALLAWRSGMTSLGPNVQDALASGGVIILITAAGGAFGQALRQTGIATSIGELVPSSSSALLWIPLAFLVTMTVRAAQGSATVSMITAVGIVAPVVMSGELTFHPLYLALAIGCGSKPLAWMNDSGFWIIAKMSGFNEIETLKTVSVMLSVMGFVGLVLTTLGAWLFPLV